MNGEAIKDDAMFDEFDMDNELFDQIDEQAIQQAAANKSADMDKDEPIKPSAPEPIENDLLSSLKIFYMKLFPFESMVRWLSYGNGEHKQVLRVLFEEVFQTTNVVISTYSVQKNYFLHREFSFTLPSDAYIRFQSFKDADALKQELIRLCPVKLDIGAVYNAKPIERKALRPGAFQPISRELIFDIDMTDYDPIRTCCKDANICKLCWGFMTTAMKIIDMSLR
ncbi:primase, DNA, polypeptide 1 (49kDa), partial [Blyttiomyces sp. JEL0837]